jgi:hypothetical protein
MGLLDVASEDSDLVAFMRLVGWFPGRSVDIHADMEAWTSRDYSVPVMVQEFMKECGGLQFEYAGHAATGGTQTCFVSGAVATSRIARSLVMEYEEVVGHDMFPVGMAADGNLWLLMCSEGPVFGARDRFLARVSEDPYRALLAIRNGESLRPVTPR